VSAAKGTEAYDEIFEKLKSISYAAGDDGEEQVEDDVDSEGLDEQDRQIMDSIIEEEEGDYSKASVIEINNKYFTL